MADVKQVQIGTSTYNIGTHSSSTFVGTSNDVADGSATSWTTVDKLTSGETTGSIFTKMSSMFKNIRYLYARLGTTDISGVGTTVTSAIAALNSGKAASSHSHATGTLPVSTTQVNSNAYIPTSALVYSMNQTIASLNDAWMNSGNIINGVFDFNNYTNPGIYSVSLLVSSYPSILNYPPGINTDTWGLLVIFSSLYLKTQYFMDAISGTTVWTRTYISDQLTTPRWTNWVRLDNDGGGTLKSGVKSVSVSGTWRGSSGSYSNTVYCTLTNGVWTSLSTATANWSDYTNYPNVSVGTIINNGTTGTINISYYDSYWCTGYVTLTGNAIWID